MRQDQDVMNQEALDRLEARLRRGIPKWEQEAFIEQVVPQLVAKLQKYLRFEPRS